MIVETHKCDNCGRTSSDVYAEKGWIFIDDCGLHITNGRTEGNARVERFYAPLRFAADDGSLDFCSLRCFLEWLFLSKKTCNNSHKSTKEQKKFMEETLKNSRIELF